jgi:hypothetical protein
MPLESELLRESEGAQAEEDDSGYGQRKHDTNSARLL